MSNTASGPLFAQAAICMGCGDPVATVDPYYELQLHAVDDPTVAITVLVHAGCNVTRVLP